MTFLNELKIAKHYYDRDRIGPVMVDVHPTLACQNNCNFCISSNSFASGVEKTNFSRSHVLDWPKLNATIDEFYDMNVRSIQLTGGGEPTLYPHFSEMTDRMNGFSNGLITNGILVGKYADPILSNIDWVRISLDASNPAMYKQIKVNDAFDKVIDSLHCILDERNSSSRTTRIGVAYVITANNINGIEEIAGLMNEIKPDYLQFKDVVNRDMTLTDYCHKKIDNAVERARSRTSVPILYTKHTGIDFNQDPLKTCRALDYVTILGADGNVYSCCHLEYLPQSSYGSIYRDSFKNIWLNRPSLKINEELCWNCRFGSVNKVISTLDAIEDGNFL